MNELERCNQLVSTHHIPGYIQQVSLTVSLAWGEEYEETDEDSRESSADDNMCRLDLLVEKLGSLKGRLGSLKVLSIIRFVPPEGPPKM
ncbi:hypothetical protein PM082_009457 [Marasmius tenuissimus]|nr:hypothetical protein PM082_009457 [Marasmius tenuissimus]